MTGFFVYGQEVFPADTVVTATAAGWALGRSGLGTDDGGVSGGGGPLQVGLSLT